MIRISTDSWHFKLVCNVLGYQRDVPHNQPPKTLCPYFWSTVSSILLFPIWKIVMSLKMSVKDVRRPKLGRRVAWGRILRICVIGWCIGFFIYDMYRALYLSAAFMVAFAVLNILPRGYIWGKIDEFSRKHRNTDMVPKPRKEKEEKIKKQRKPNILLEYIKARKQKACPLLEFVDPIDEL